MPIASYKLPDGRIVDYEVPEGMSPEEIDRAVASDLRSLVTPPPAPKKEESGFFRQALDVPVGVAKGAVSGVRMIADAFGADNPVSQALSGAEGYLGNLLSAQAKNDQQEIARIMQDAEDKGFGEQVKAAIKALTVAPVDLLSSALGTAAPTLVGGLATTALRGGALAVRAAQAGTGAVMGAGVTKGTIYESTKQALLEAGTPEDQAEARAQLAQSYGGQNLDQILMGTAIGGLAGSTGVEKALAGPLARSILGRAAAKEGAEDIGKLTAGRVGAAAVREAAPETIQGAQERLAQNIALQREEFDVPTMRGVVGAGALEGLIGGGLGAAVDVARGSQVTPRQPAPPPSGTTEAETTTAAGVADPATMTPAQRYVELFKLRQGEQTEEVKARIAALEEMNVQDAQRMLDERAGKEPTSLKEQVQMQPPLQMAMRDFLPPETGVRPADQLAGPPQREAEFGTVLTPEILLGTGLKKQSGFFKELAGKDLKKDEDRAAVNEILQRVRKNERLSESTKAAVERVTQREFATLATQQEMFGPRGGVRADADAKAQEERRAAQEAKAAEKAAKEAEKAAKATTPSAPTVDEAAQPDLFTEEAAAEPETEAEIPATTVSEKTFEQLGVGPTNKKLREQILGKDLTDAAQAAEVRDALEDFANAPNRSKKLRDSVEQFLAQPFFAGEQRGTIEQPGAVDTGAGEPSVSVPRAGQRRPAGPVPLDLRGLGSAVQDTGTAETGETGEQRALSPKFVEGARKTYNRLKDKADPKWEDLGAEQQSEFMDAYEAETGQDRFTGKKLTAKEKRQQYQQEQDQKAAEGIANDPTEEEASTVQKALEGKSPADAIKWLAANAPDPDQRVIAQRVADRLKELEANGLKFSLKIAHIGDIVPLGLNRARGATIANYKGDKASTVEIYLNGADVTGKVGTSYEVALHEFVHAATMGAIRLGNYKAAAGTQLANSVKALYDVSQEVVRHFNERAKNPDQLTDFERAIYERRFNAVRDADEILTWALTNRDMQKYLESIPYKNTRRSLWSEIVTAVRNFLGLTPEADTALSEVLKVADELLSSSIPEMQGAAVLAKTSLAEAVDTRAANFSKWFGNSVVVNKNGKPKVMYHGTARDITEFRPKQANAIFVTDNPRFAESFALRSEDWMLEQAMTGKESTKQLERMRDKLETRANIMPVYVRAETPFDYNFDPHIDAVIEEAAKRGVAVDRVGLERGYWSVIERPEIQSIIRDLGFDSFYIVEAGVRNLAVYSPNQIKSATGNDGTYSRETNDIRYASDGRSEQLYEEAKATLEATKGIANEKARGPEMSTLKKVGAFFLDPSYRQDVVDRLRVQVAYKGASVERKLMDAYNGAIRDSLGNIRPDLFMTAAEHSDTLTVAVMKDGTLRLDKDIGWVAEKGPASMTGVMDSIKALGQKLGDQDMAFKLANNAFIARRARALKSKDIVDPALLPSEDKINAGLEAFKKFPELEAAFKQFTDYKNGLIDAMVEGGRLSKDKAQEWKDAADYVPWNRIKDFEETIQNSPQMFFKGLTNLKQMKAIKGGEEEINDIFDNMVGLSFWMVNSAVRNHAALQLTDVFVQNNLGAKRVYPNQRGVDPNKTIYIYRNGEPEVYEYDSIADVYAFKGVESVGGPLLKSFTAMSNFLRKTTTATPQFAISQLFQDAYRATSMSGVNSPFRVAAKVIGGFVDAYKGDATTRRLEEMGIVGMYDLMPGRAREEIEKEFGLKQRSRTERLIGAMESFSIASDAALRKAVFEQTLEETKSEQFPEGDVLLARYRAQEIINFKRQGANRTVGVLRQMVPFMNAYIQGMDVFYRTMTGRGVAAKERSEAFRLFLATGFKLATLSLIYSMLVGDDDEYKGLRDYEKDKNFVFPGTGIKIPVAPEVGFLFKVLPERAYNYIVSQGTETPQDATALRKALGTGMFDAFTGPNLTPQAIKPLLEIGVNYSFFTGAPIVGRGMENLEARQQFTASTSELSKFLGDIANVSPLKIEYFLRGTTGIAGGTALDVSNMFFTGRPERNLYQMPGFKTFMYNQIPGGYKEQYYDLRNRVDQVADTVNAFKAQGRADELEKYLTDDKMNLLALRKIMNKIDQKFEDNRAYKKVILNDPTLSGEEKTKLINEIDQYENEMLRAYNIADLRKNVAGL